MASGIKYDTKIQLNKLTSYQTGKSWETTACKPETPHGVKFTPVTGSYHGLREDLPETLPDGVTRDCWQSVEDCRRRFLNLKKEHPAWCEGKSNNQLLQDITGYSKTTERILFLYPNFPTLK